MSDTEQQKYIDFIKDSRSDINDFLYGYFAPTDKDIRLYELAKQYHDETEAYDKTVCSCINERGVAMPSSNYEFALINRNAIKVRKRILADNPGIAGYELQNAISHYVPNPEDM